MLCSRTLDDDASDDKEDSDEERMLGKVDRYTGPLVAIFFCKLFIIIVQSFDLIHGKSSIDADA